MAKRFVRFAVIGAAYLVFRYRFRQFRAKRREAKRWRKLKKRARKGGPFESHRTIPA